MPAIQKLTQLAQDKVTHGEMDFEGEVIHFAFAGGRITGADIQAYSEAAADEATAQLLLLPIITELLSRVLVTWDITNEDGSEFLPTIENLDSLLPTIRIQLMGALQRAAQAVSSSGGEGGSFAGG